MEITELAIEKLKEVMEDQGEGESSLRVIAMPAESGGVQYMLTMENESQADDTELNVSGVRFLMDSDSAPFLEEATIDFVENLGGQVGFVINNPMFASAGGCGSGCGCGSGGGGGGCGCGSGGGGGGCGGH
ncbi:MAG: iron-sulfur cluster assembly accessory protein [Chloroflexi bacterium]|nr:iron-sulfur cluster assembly accessory protein [Chloroflexota bacterium]MCI0859404.1 iron-sulfur cluster assembly accessory protein [Chloroflexota bacterium]MCI0893763.1 iron-sulfur cluster assembly accessory protein [Chloroflexota bacterium]